MQIVDLLVRTELASSKGGARRAIAARSVRIDGEVVEDEEASVTEGVLPLRLSMGRKRNAVVR